MKVILLHHPTTLFYYRLDKETASSKTIQPTPRTNMNTFKSNVYADKDFKMFIYVLLLNVI